MPMECEHVQDICDVIPSALGCEECLKIGSPWVLCRTCGHVGCCDVYRNPGQLRRRERYLQNSSPEGVNFGCRLTASGKTLRAALRTARARVCLADHERRTAKRRVLGMVRRG